MSGAAIDWANALVAREQQAGFTRPESIRRVADRARVSPGQIEGLIRKRVKDPKLSLVERLRAVFIAAATSEIERLQHEIRLARAAGMAADDRMVGKARAAMDALRAMIAEGAP